MHYLSHRTFFRSVLTPALAIAGLSLTASAVVPSNGTAIESAAVLTTSNLDPRLGEVQVADWQPAGDGRYMVVRAERQSFGQALWFVDLAEGTFTQWEQGEPTGSPLRWTDGKLVTEVLREGRRELVSIDPSSGAFERVEDSGAKTPWATVTMRSLASGRRLLEIEYTEQGTKFELPSLDTRFQLTDLPGVVFYSIPEEKGELGHDAPAIRVMRHDMNSGTTVEVATVGGEDPRWEPSADGKVVAVVDDKRARMVNPEDGSTKFDPMPAGRVTWLENEHSHLMLTAGGHHYVLDLYSGQRLRLGEESGEQPRVRVLNGGGYLVSRGGGLDHLDKQGELIANLIPGSV